MRRAAIDRSTAETAIHLELDLDGGAIRIATGLSFFDHMLHQLARHGGLGLVLEARGDLAVDGHHLVEDVGLCLGEALSQALAKSCPL
jgi:imidazoleglycerol phosphate dehydratase HisB